MSKIKEFELVEITWIDAEKDDEGWSSDDPDSPPTILRTFGLLIREDKNYVVHASTYDPSTGKYSERAKIPPTAACAKKEEMPYKCLDSTRVTC